MSRNIENSSAALARENVFPRGYIHNTFHFPWTRAVPISSCSSLNLLTIKVGGKISAPRIADYAAPARVTRERLSVLICPSQTSTIRASHEEDSLESTYLVVFVANSIPSRKNPQIHEFTNDEISPGGAKSPPSRTRFSLLSFFFLLPRRK